SALKTRRHTPLEDISKFGGVRLVHHRHTGRHVHRQYTAYSALFFILALTGATLLLVGVSVKAGPPQTYSGDINLTGIVTGPPPSTPAAFTEPKNGVFVTKSEVTLKGTCEPQEHGRVIEIYRLSAFAGSTQCTPDGNFEIIITLVPGKNELIARTVDWVGQYGPDSEKFVIFYDVPLTDPNDPGTLINNLPPLQLFTKDHVFKGINRNKLHPFKYEVKGGKAPYAVTVDWDDDTHNDVASLRRGGDFNFSHEYRKSGLYKLTFSAADFYSNKATFQVLAVVNETVAPPNYVGVATPGPSAVCAGDPNGVECYVTSQVANIVDKLWPAFIIACLMTLSFWIGEKMMYLHYFHHKRGRRNIA
ncbi:MAG: hypothetical protein ACRD4B_02000, partial [Acidobacteriota bacterium]